MAIRLNVDNDLAEADIRLLEHYAYRFANKMLMDDYSFSKIKRTRIRDKVITVKLRRSVAVSILGFYYNIGGYRNEVIATIETFGSKGTIQINLDFYEEVNDYFY